MKRTNVRQLKRAWHTNRNDLCSFASDKFERKSENNDAQIILCTAPLVCFVCSIERKLLIHKFWNNRHCVCFCVWKHYRLWKLLPSVIHSPSLSFFYQSIGSFRFIYSIETSISRVCCIVILEIKIHISCLVLQYMWFLGRIRDILCISAYDVLSISQRAERAM